MDELEQLAMFIYFIQMKKLEDVPYQVMIGTKNVISLLTIHLEIFFNQ